PRGGRRADRRGRRECRSPAPRRGIPTRRTNNREAGSGAVLRPRARRRGVERTQRRGIDRGEAPVRGWERSATAALRAGPFRKRPRTFRGATTEPDFLLQLLLAPNPHHADG